MRISFYLSLCALLTFSCQHEAVHSGLTIESEGWGTMQAHRIEHRASLLPGGQVLVTGGSADGFAHEVFSPLASTWKSLDSTRFGYESHGQALLPEGRVLIAGGYQSHVNSGTVTKRIGTRAEILDLQSHTWKEVAEMLVPRASFSTTLLDDNRIMVAGGHVLDTSGSRPIARMGREVEVFDPEQESWSMLSPMIQARGAHESLKLPDGRVMVLGGNPNAFYGEIYNPSTDQWQAIATLDEGPRRGFRAILLNENQVLLSGGVYEGVEGNRICSIYTLSTDTWTQAASMIEPRYDHSLISIAPGKVLAIAGHSLLDDHPFYPTVQKTASCELYEQQDNSWKSVGMLSTPRAGHIAIEYADDKVFVVGGNAPDGMESEIMKTLR